MDVRIFHGDSGQNHAGAAVGQLVPKTFKNHQLMGLSLYHLVREPKVKKEKNPLLLLLHGYGSNDADLFSFASELPDEYYVISARAPYDLMYGSYAWYAIDF